MLFRSMNFFLDRDDWPEGSFILWVRSHVPAQNSINIFPYLDFQELILYKIKSAACWLDLLGRDSQMIFRSGTVFYT